jgi:hypothetical protein
VQGRDVSARVQISRLSDLFIKEFQKAFHVGMLVKGRVLSLTPDGKIELSLRKVILMSLAERLSGTAWLAAFVKSNPNILRVPNSRMWTPTLPHH